MMFKSDVIYIYPKSLGLKFVAREVKLQSYSLPIHGGVNSRHRAPKSCLYSCVKCRIMTISIDECLYDWSEIA